MIGYLVCPSSLLHTVKSGRKLYDGQCFIVRVQGWRDVHNHVRTTRGAS